MITKHNCTQYTGLPIILCLLNLSLSKQEVLRNAGGLALRRVNAGGVIKAKIVITTNNNSVSLQA